MAGGTGVFVGNTGKVGNGSVGIGIVGNGRVAMGVLVGKGTSVGGVVGVGFAGVTVTDAPRGPATQATWPVVNVMVCGCVKPV